MNYPQTNIQALVVKINHHVHISLRRPGGKRRTNQKKIVVSSCSTSYLYNETNFPPHFWEVLVKIAAKVAVRQLAPSCFRKLFPFLQSWPPCTTRSLSHNEWSQSTKYTGESSLPIGKIFSPSDVLFSNLNISITIRDTKKLLTFSENLGN